MEPLKDRDLKQRRVLAPSGVMPSAGTVMIRWKVKGCDIHDISPLSATISERITPAKAPPPLERGHGEVTNPPPTSQTSKAYNWTVMQVSNWLHEEGLDIIKDK